MALEFLFLLGGTEAIAEPGLQRGKILVGTWEVCEGSFSFDPFPHPRQIFFPLILLLMFSWECAVSSFCRQLLGGPELQAQAVGATCSSGGSVLSLGINDRKLRSLKTHFLVFAIDVKTADELFLMETEAITQESSCMQGWQLLDTRTSAKRAERRSGSHSAQPHLAAFQPLPTGAKPTPCANNKNGNSNLHSAVSKYFRRALIAPCPFFSLEDVHLTSGQVVSSLGSTKASWDGAGSGVERGLPVGIDGEVVGPHERLRHPRCSAILQPTKHSPAPSNSHLARGSATGMPGGSTKRGGDFGKSPFPQESLLPHVFVFITL